MSRQAMVGSPNGMHHPLHWNTRCPREGRGTYRFARMADDAVTGKLFSISCEPITALVFFVWKFRNGHRFLLGAAPMGNDLV